MQRNGYVAGLFGLLFSVMGGACAPTDTGNPPAGPDPIDEITATDTPGCPDDVCPKNDDEWTVYAKLRSDVVAVRGFEFGRGPSLGRVTELSIPINDHKLDFLVRKTSDYLRLVFFFKEAAPLVRDYTITDTYPTEIRQARVLLQECLFITDAYREAIRGDDVIILDNQCERDVELEIDNEWSDVEIKDGITRIVAPASTQTRIEVEVMRVDNGDSFVFFDDVGSSDWLVVHWGETPSF